MAKRAYSKFVHMFPHKATPWHDLGVALTRLESIPTSTQAESTLCLSSYAFRRALVVSPLNSSLWVSVACAEKSPSRRQHALIRALQLDAKNLRAWEQLVLLYLEQNDLEQADNVLQTFHTLEPLHPGVWIGHGLLQKKLYEAEVLKTGKQFSVQEKQRRRKKVLDAFAQAVEFQPTKTGRLHLAIACVWFKRYREAEVHFSQYLTQVENDASAWNLLSICLEQQGRFDFGLSAIERSLSIINDNTSRAFAIALNNKARVLCKSWRTNEALEIYSKLTTSSPEPVQLLLNQAWVHARTRSWTESEKLLLECSKSIVSMSKHRAFRVMIGLAQLYAKQQRLKDAVAACMKCLDLGGDKDIASLSLCLAVSYISGNEELHSRTDSAFNSLAVDSTADTLLLKALVQLKTKEIQSAIRTLQAAVLRFPASNLFRGLLAHALLLFAPAAVSSQLLFSTDTILPPALSLITSASALSTLAPSAAFLPTVLRDRFITDIRHQYESYQKLIHLEAASTLVSSPSRLKSFGSVSAQSLLMADPTDWSRWLLLVQQQIASSIPAHNSDQLHAAIRVAERIASQTESAPQWQDVYLRTVVCLVETSCLPFFQKDSKDTEKWLTKLTDAVNSIQASDHEKSRWQAIVHRLQAKRIICESTRSGQPSLDSAMHHYHTSLQLNPSDVATWTELAYAYLQAGFPSAAERCLQRSTEYIETVLQANEMDAKVKVWTTRLRYALLCMDLGLLKQALEAATSAANSCPDSAVTWLVRVMVLRRLKRWNQAENLIQRCIKLDPTLPTAHLQKALIHIQKEENESAATELDIEMKLLNGSTIASLNLRTVLEKQMAAVKK
eukprot:GILK01011509.1.p1 GENE.GILK01011509.1~~GILK01011509.1.p1  ORF type:complete len:962 (+),score=207.24 GILK01011509.1:364-2886(+)